MKKELWNLYAPIYEKAMRADQKTYQFMYERIPEIIRNKEVLEIATGPGLLARHVAMAAKRMVATDYSEGMIREAKKGEYPSNLTFEIADATDLPYKDKSFDVVLVANALHIIPNPEKALQEIDRVLRPGGILIAPTFVEHQTGAGSRFWSRILKLAGIKFEHQWKAQEYLEFLEENGWSVIFSKELSARITIMYAECERLSEKMLKDAAGKADHREAINTGYASISVNKELQRVTKTALKSLENKDVILVFPAKTALTSTVLVLKAPKTEGSTRKIFLPKTVANMLIEWKKEQDFVKEALGNEYQDYNLVMAGPVGFPIEASTMQAMFSRLIEKHGLPRVVFHSLRHSSITYKLKLNGGDVKAVQGDSGHSQTSMVTDVYSHILDDDRRMNAQLFEDAFYSRKDADPSAPAKPLAPEEQKASDMDTLMRLLSNPETAGLLKQLVKAMDK